MYLVIVQIYCFTLSVATPCPTRVPGSFHNYPKASDGLFLIVASDHCSIDIISRLFPLGIDYLLIKLFIFLLLSVKMLDVSFCFFFICF